MDNLPQGVIEENGRLVRLVPKVAASGETWNSRRPVALTIEEARLRRYDYYHPELGWILEGYKLEKDRTPESRMADVSQSVLAEPPEPEAMRTAAPPEIPRDEVAVDLGSE
ncbi:hypothetical protein LCGC14_1226690 [marine sediment metagenome]|uniref:Uncharacterized protein n=1 Tax=marine sediment metagenome TaxID=412755 RepID=A0A0F9LWV5_9ZZZZ